MLLIAHHPSYAHALPEGHRFPMEKYELLPQQLLYEGTVKKQHFFIPSPLSEANILLTHDKGYWRKLQDLSLTRREERATGFPLSTELVQREIIIAQGTLDGAIQVLKHGGVALNIAGGTHHAFADHGEGFCLLNDIAISANYVLQYDLCCKVMVVDLDVHQGNGTAKLFEGDDRVFTFSMHGANNYPLRKEQSDLDIGLPDKTGDEVYLRILKTQLETLLSEQEPDLVIYQSGVDVLASDKLGRLGLSIQGCKERDQLVFEACFKDQIPMVVVMGGGYSPKISTIIEAHANTFRIAASYCS